MADKIAALLAEIRTDVKYLRESFDEHKMVFKEHVDKDDRIANDYIKPLWEESQQRKGMAKVAGVMYSMLGGVFALTGKFLMDTWK